MILGATVRLRDQFSGTMGKMSKGISTFNKQTRESTKDVSVLSSKLRLMKSMVVRPVIKVKDEASRKINNIKGSITSLKGLVAIGLGAMGLQSVGRATLGQAMTLEAQMVSMEHWLNGNKKLAQETVGWLNEFAAATPFEMADLFPSMTRAIGIGNGDIRQAKEMVKLATDMAALTPGKTVQDAMEALADAQMGEFERMKEFSMKVTQEQPYDNYLALLHRGERVMTAAENRQYQRGRRPSTIIFQKLADRIDASNPADVDRLLDKIEERLLQVSLNTGAA